MARAGPPAYAWDWFARQRLPWRRARERIATSTSPAAARYRAVADRSDVLPMLRFDYPRDEIVRHVVHEVVTDVVFLGKVARPFAELGVTSPPRGMRWWWAALTGEDIDARPDRTSTGPSPVQTRLELDEGPAERLPVEHVHPKRGDEPAELPFDEVLEGYGD